MTLFLKPRPSAAGTRLDSLIAEGVELTGDLNFGGGLRIDGHVRGNLIGRPSAGQALPLLVVSAKGHVEGSVSCGNAVIDGTVDGDLEITNFLELQSNSRVCGTIRYGQLLIERGASISGQLSKTASASPAEAVPKPAPEAMPKA